MQKLRWPNQSASVRGSLIGCLSLETDDPAELYHEASRYYPDCLVRPSPITGAPVSDDTGTWVPAKVRSHQAGLRLPRPDAPDVPFLKVLGARRSLAPAGTAVSLSALATLLYAAGGITESDESSHRRRSTPSAGALYPLDWYVATLEVAEVTSGLYHYEPFSHSLEPVSMGDPRPLLTRALLTADLLASCRAVVMVTGMFARTRQKYGLRGYRFVLLEAGHSMQNLLLAATCLGIGATPIGGYLDSELDDLVRVNGVDETTLYAAAVG